MDVGLLRLPRFGGATYAHDYDNRSRHRQVSVSGARLYAVRRRETRHQNIPLRDKTANGYLFASFRTPILGVYLRNAAISRRFERDPIPYALETDCPLGHIGLELANPSARYLIGFA
jgi:hypothetical protein